jgi:hypothetical protein
MLDYEAIALSRLTGQFANSPKVNALMAQIVGPLTLVEDDADTLKTDRWIATAIGKQLDGVGAIVGEPRNGRDDDSYRRAIQFRVFVNISNGTPRDLIQGLVFLTQPTDSQYLEIYPATINVFTNGFFVDIKTAAAMRDLSPVAVRTVLTVSFADKPFRFGRSQPLGELFVNMGNSYLEANGSDIQVTDSLTPTTGSGLGGCVPAELDVGIGYLDVGGPTLAVYSPNYLNTLGHYNLTGVFE